MFFVAIAGLFLVMGILAYLTALLAKHHTKS